MFQKLSEPTAREVSIWVNWRERERRNEERERDQRERDQRERKRKRRKGYYYVGG